MFSQCFGGKYTFSIRNFSHPCCIPSFVAIFSFLFIKPPTVNMGDFVRLGQVIKIRYKIFTFELSDNSLLEFTDKMAGITSSENGDITFETCAS